MLNGHDKKGHLVMNMSNLVGKLESLCTTLNSHIDYLDRNEGESEIMEKMDQYHRLVNSQVAAAVNMASFEYLQDSIKQMIKKSRPRVGMSSSQGEIKEVRGKNLLLPESSEYLKNFLSDKKTKQIITDNKLNEVKT